MMEIFKELAIQLKILAKAFWNALAGLRRK